MNRVLGFCLAMAVGCTQLPQTQSPAPTQTGGVVDIGAPRVEVVPSSVDQQAARAKALMGVEGRGWVFDPLFATARNARGDDTAVCGHGHQPGSDNTLFFAVYQGELLLWDDRAPAGLSVENQFLTLICSTEPPVNHARGAVHSTQI